MSPDYNLAQVARHGVSMLKRTCDPGRASIMVVTGTASLRPDSEAAASLKIEENGCGMKITCQACQAKYTIADEKVLGKVVKIRCKKCGATIMVNGNDPSGPVVTQPPTVAGTPEQGGEARGNDEWTVNVAEGDQRTMTEAEIVAAYRAGVVHGDTFCWKEGTPDWLPLQDIALLRAACIGASSPAAGVSPRSFAKAGNGVSAGAPPVAARRSGARAPVADLFGGAARAGGEDEVMTSAPASMPQPQPQDGQKLIGARNENSVLFALHANPDKGAPPPQPTMTATNEASGLIDIRQLSAQMRSGDEKKKSRVDDIMNLGGGGFAPSLAAPVLSAPSLEHYSHPPTGMSGVHGSDASALGRNRPLIFLALGVGTFLLVAAVGIAALVMRGKGSATDDRERTLASGIAAEAPAAPGASVAMNVPPAKTSDVPAPSAAPAVATAAPPETAPPPMAAPGPLAGTTAPQMVATPKETTAKEPQPAPREPTAPTKEPKPVAASGAGADEKFNMGEAKARLGAISSAAQSCKRGDTAGSGRVEIVFAPSGAVQSASLVPGSPFEGTSTGACVVARFRTARVPPFGGSPFTVTKSFNVN
jgi:predicted Zn finger-like uncharacterized protein